MSIKQTAGKEQLADFAPKFAQLNDEVLFGEVWSREDKLSLKMRSVVTLTALISKGIVDSSLSYHLSAARKNGITRTEMAEILTHLAFYAGWPNAWAAFRMAKEVYADDGEQEQHGGFFGQGEPNTAYCQYFIGNSYLKPLTDPKNTSVFIANVTFEPGCRNNWHIHHRVPRPKLRPQMFRVAVVAGNAPAVTFPVADDDAVRQRVQSVFLTEICEQLHRRLIGPFCHHLCLC